MQHQKMAKLYETQISLTEWLKNVGHKDATAMRHEDGEKRNRIAAVNEIIGVPYDKPTKFEATDLRDRTEVLKEYISEHGDEVCALRLIPKDEKSTLPNLRMRGLTVKEALKWFDEQKIDAKLFRADYVPHPPDYSWATIFVVNDNGIFGEVYYGAHSILTQGFYESSPPMVFSYDFKSWKVEPDNKEALEYLKKLVNYIYVEDEQKRAELRKRVQAKFAHNYLKGYFESTHSNVVGTWFIDYNRILGERYSDFTATFTSSDTNDVLVKGRSGSKGIAQGMVRIINDPEDADDFKKGDILVCSMTSPDYIGLMQKAGAFVTDQGGILCHAAIIAREIGVPCVVGTGDATSVLKTGQSVIVDADKGVVKEVK